MSGDGPFGGEMGRMGDSTVEGGAGERRTRGSTMGSDIVSGSVSTGSDVTGRTGPEITGPDGTDGTDGTDGGEKLLSYCVLVSSSSSPPEWLSGGYARSSKRCNPLLTSAC